MTEGEVCEMGGRSGEGTRSAMVGRLDARRVQLRLTGGMFAVPNVSASSVIPVSGMRRGPSGEPFARRSRDPCGISSGWKYAFRASVMMCREEQFLRAYCKGQTEAEFNNLGIPCFALFALKVASRGSYQNECGTVVPWVECGRRTLSHAGMTTGGHKKASRWMFEPLILRPGRIGRAGTDVITLLL